MSFRDLVLPGPDIQKIPAAKRPEKGSYPERFLLTDFYSSEYIEWRDSFLADGYAMRGQHVAGDIIPDDYYPSIEEAPFGNANPPEDLGGFETIIRVPNALQYDTLLTLSTATEDPKTPPTIPKSGKARFMYNGYCITDTKAHWVRISTEAPDRKIISPNQATALGKKAAFKDLSIADHPSQTAIFKPETGFTTLNPRARAHKPPAYYVITPITYRLVPDIQKLPTLYNKGYAVPSPLWYDVSHRPVDRRRAESVFYTTSHIQQINEEYQSITARRASEILLQGLRD